MQIFLPSNCELTAAFELRNLGAKLILKEFSEIAVGVEEEMKSEKNQDSRQAMKGVMSNYVK